MGHKAVVIVDLDHLDRMDQDPAEFVRRLKNSLLAHRRTGGSVSVGGATVANVVWSGHADLSPTLKFVDYRAENLSYPSSFPKPTPEEADATVRKLMEVGARVEAVREYRKNTGAGLREALNHVDSL